MSDRFPRGEHPRGCIIISGEVFSGPLEAHEERRVIYCGTREAELQIAKHGRGAFFVHDMWPARMVRSDGEMIEWLGEAGDNEPDRG